jgi:predicted O-methyltransferase YrrM
MKLFEHFAYGELDKLGHSIATTLYQQQPPWAAAASISTYDAQFLAGLVLAIRPLKVVEVGVASGWGSVVLLKALEESGLTNYQYLGVDLVDRFFCDPTYATGQAVQQVLPALADRYQLMTGRSIAEAGPDIGGGTDLAFIDAHHMHPWATLDLLALLPFLSPGSWVALHDLNLCRKEDQGHQNRGPKYLFEGWEGDRAHSIQVPPMAGAIHIGAAPVDQLPLLLDILYTPWEMQVEQRFLAPVSRLISDTYGPEWGEKFRRAMEVGNYFVGKMHSPDINALTAERAKLRAERPKNRGFFKRLKKRLRR